MFPSCRTSTCTSQSTVAVEIAAKDLGLSAIHWLDVDILELETRARCALTAIDGRGDIVPRGTRDVLPSNVGDFEVRIIAFVVRVDARRDVYGLVDIDYVEVAECHIPDVSLAWVRLNPCSVGTVQGLDIFEDDVFDCLGDVGWVAHGSDDHGA